MKSPDKLCLTAFVFSCVLAAGVQASEPMAVTIPWQKPGGSAPSREMPGAQLEGTVKGATGGLEKAGKVGDLGSKALDFSKSLSATDDRLKADYNPPGAPGVPSKCMENAKCRPCYTEAYAKVNKTRKALEKVRAHYDYTHRLSADGIALMQSVAATAGGPAGIGAAVETRNVNESVKEFDKVVRNKNAELLARLQGELMEVNTCEATYYGTNDWYDRFGYMYLQFMQANYGYAVSHSAP